MSQLVLQKIIKQCASQTMSSRQMQFTLCKLANYIQDREQIKGQIQIDTVVNNVNDASEQQLITQKWKQYIDKQIARVEEVFLRKLNQVQKIEVRIGGLCEQFEKVTNKITKIESLETKIDGLCNETKTINSKLTQVDKIKEFSNETKKITNKLTEVSKIKGLCQEMKKVNNKLTQIQKIKGSLDELGKINMKLTELEKIKGELCQKLEKISKKQTQIEIVESRIEGLYDQTKKINEKLTEIEKIKQHSNEIQKINNKLVQLEKVEKVEQRIERICEQIEKINKIIENQERSIQEKDQKFTKEISQNGKFLSKFEISLNEQIQKINSEMKIFLDNKNNSSNDVMPSQKLQNFYKQQKCSKFFSFDGKILKKLKEDRFYCQFIFNYEIPLDKQFIFKIKIVQSKLKLVLIGIVDYDKQKQQQCSSHTKNAICYFAHNGYIYPNEIKHGDGINVGETVEVRVDRRNNTIIWMVNNEQRASYHHRMLRDQNRKLMPYVELGNIGDTIEWIE